jgi:hypothetical protein
MSKLKLTYFDFHGGRGEPARLALSIGEIPFEHDRVPPAEWEGRKARKPRSALYLSPFALAGRCHRGLLRSPRNVRPGLLASAKLIQWWQATGSGADGGLMGITCYMVRPTARFHVLAFVNNGACCRDGNSGTPAQVS